MPKRQTQRIIDSRTANRSVNITGITVSAPSPGVDASVAGDGLTHLAGVLSVGAGDGVTVSADAVAVDSSVVRTTRNLTAGSGLTGGGTLAGDRTFAVGAGAGITVNAGDVALTTPGSLTAATTNSASGNHTHAIDSTIARSAITITAGNGLTGGGNLTTNRTLAVGAGAGITVNVGDVALTTPGSLSATSSNAASGNHTHAIATGAASTLTVSTTNTTGTGSNLARADHTHAITSSSNPGATASLLATDASGYLRLARIGLGMTPTRPLDVTGDAGVTGQVIAGSGAFSGSVSITNGGDLTVGTVLQVSASGTRVGINRAPDQQFDLDVAGAIRGQYLIGKHAIQLASAVGVWHFDGPAPHNLDFSGSNASHMGVGGTETGGVIYRPGKFGKAVQVAEATTNLVLRPCFRDIAIGSTLIPGGWDYYNGGTAVIVSGGVISDRSLRVTSQQVGINAISATAGVVHTISVWIHKDAVSGYACNSDWSGAIYIANWSLIDTSPGGWQRRAVQFTPTSTSIRLVFDAPMVINAVQVEQKAYATPYCDGSLGSGHSWSGTAHASTSARSLGYIDYTPNPLPAMAGSVMIWIKRSSTSGDSYILVGGSTFNQFSILSNPQVILFGGAQYNLSALPVGSWAHIALTWTQGELKIYENGELKQTATGATYTPSATMQLGAYASTYSANCLIDDFVILDYAADPKLIRAIYESDAPVFVESSVFHWRSPSRVPIWVDEFGLWARGVSGNEILGLYGGDPRNPTGNVTRSWGGITMEENDIVIGRTAGGYIHWDDSAQTMTVQGTITATAGSIGGWTIDSTKLARDTGTAATSAGLAPNDFPVYAGSTFANRVTAPFRVTTAGALVATNATITGTVTATAGTIGGWTIGSTLSATNLVLIPGAANVAHIVAGTGATAGGINAADAAGVVFWAGSTHANRASAAFRVTAAGALVATNATITGTVTATAGTIGGWTLAASSLTAGSGSTIVGGRVQLSNTGMAMSFDITDTWTSAQRFSFLRNNLSGTEQGWIGPRTFSGGQDFQIDITSLGNGGSWGSIKLHAATGTAGSMATNAGVLLVQAGNVFVPYRGLIVHNDFATYGATVSTPGSILAKSIRSTDDVGYDWSALTPDSGWANFDTANYPSFGVKRFGNLVSIKGVVRATVSKSGYAQLYQLPAEYRPTRRRLFTCWSTEGITRVDIAPDGIIYIERGIPLNGTVSLEITYFTGG